MADYFISFDRDATFGVSSVGIGSPSTGLGHNSFSQSQQVCRPTFNFSDVTPDPEDPPPTCEDSSFFSSLDFSMLDSLPPLHPEPARKIFGPKVGVRHPVFGMDKPTVLGHLRLVTQTAGDRVSYGKGVGVDQFEVDGIDGPPRPGVVEKLAIVVHKINGAKPNEKPKAPVERGQRFLDAPIRRKAMALGVRKSKACPDEGNILEVGISFWRVAPNRFHVIIAEPEKDQDDKMDIGIKRTASWQFCYTQVDEASGDVLLERIIPGTYIICAGCDAVNDRNRKNEILRNERKLALIDLLKRLGAQSEAHAFEKRISKQKLGEILMCASGHGVSNEMLETTIGATYEEKRKDYVRKLMRDWEARQARDQARETKRASAAAPSGDESENKSKKNKRPSNGLFNDRQFRRGISQSSEDRNVRPRRHL